MIYLMILTGQENIFKSNCYPVSIDNTVYTIYERQITAHILYNDVF